MTGCRLAVLVLSLLSFLAAPTGAAAQPVPGLDLVVAIDQSGSLWGHPEYHPQPNDRYGHRIGATRSILERLAADAEDRSRVHRFSIVDFSDEARVAWSGHVLRHEPSDPGALGRGLEVGMVKHLGERRGVNTNTPAALRAALGELRDMDGAAAGAQRRKVVLLLTDGRPQLPPAGRGEMLERTRRAAEDLLASGAELWVVALNDSSQYWLEGDGAFWQQVVGDPARTHLAERAVPGLPAGVDRMVNEWLDLGEVPDSPYTAPPYLGHLAFRLSFERPRDPDTVRVLSPAGRPLPRTSADVGGPATYARFALDDPPAGPYRVEGGAGVVHAAAEPHPPTVRRLLPAAGVDLDADTPVLFQASLGSGAPLRLAEEHPLRAVVEVVDPEGGRQEIAAEDAGEGRFRARWRPVVAGEHQLTLRGWIDHQGSPLDVFATAAGAGGTVEVSSARALWLRLERPDPEYGLSAYPWSEEAEVRLRLTGADGGEIPVADVVTDAVDWLTLEPLDAEGRPSAEPRALEPGTGGRFSASIPLDLAPRRTPGLWNLGSASFRVAAAEGRLAEGWEIRGIALPEGSEGLRLESDPWAVGPLPVRLARSLVWGGVLVALFLVAGIVTLVGPRALADWRVRRTDRGRVFTVRVYDVLADPQGAMAITHRVSGRSRFKLDGKVRLTLGTETRVADRFRITRLNSPGRAKARLDYRWSGEKKTLQTYLAAGGGPKTLRVEGVTAGRPVAELVEG